MVKQTGDSNFWDSFLNTILSPSHTTWPAAVSMLGRPACCDCGEQSEVSVDR